VSAQREFFIGADRPPRRDGGDDINRSIGRRLRRRRRLMGLTQSDVAERCGVRFQQVQKYEAGQTGISAVQLVRLADVLSVPVGYFFEGVSAA
jgi:transcriptional regulator with XRE-family HTH domain